MAEEPYEERSCPWTGLPASRCPNTLSATWSKQDQTDHIEWHCKELVRAGIMQEHDDGTYSLTDKGKEHYK